MRLYLAGIYAANFHKGGQLYARLNDAEKAARSSVRYVLDSYHYIHRQTAVDRIRADNVQVFLDSGAFSAFTKGAEVDMAGYVDYIKRNDDIIVKDDGALCASVLDGIGDPLKTWQNQKAMESMGVRPLPCFHYGEDERYLEYYIANYDYITLGGMVPISSEQLYHWLDRIWERYLTDGSGTPRLKVHGFGLTTQGIMERYPWYSVDSSTWVQAAAMGGIWLPPYGVLAISEHSPAKRFTGRHYNTMSEEHQRDIERRIAERGYEIERLRTLYLSRWSFNIHAYQLRNDSLMDRSPLFVDEQMKFF